MIFDYSNAHDGSVTVNGIILRYAAIEPILSSGTPSDVTFNLPSGADDAVLEDDGAASFRLRSANATFEATTFGAPTHSLMIVGSTGDTLLVSKAVSMAAPGSSIQFDVSAISLAADLSAESIVGDSTATQTLNVASNSAEIADAIALAASGATINVAPGSYTGSVDFTGKALNLAVQNGPGVVTINGNLTLDADDAVRVKIDGIMPGSEHDQLIVVDGNCVFGGATLSSSIGYSPSAGDIVQVVEHSGTGSISGTFDYSVTTGFRASYSATRVDLIQNRPPVADAGSVYTISEGGSLSLNGSGSADLDIPQGDELEYSWDINGHPAVATGASPPALNWTQLQSLGIVSVGNYPAAIVLHVIDGFGLTSTVTANLTVNSSVPTASFARVFANVNQGTANVVRFTDQFDPTATGIENLRYSYDFNNDGIFDLGDGTYLGSSLSAQATVPSLYLLSPGPHSVRGRVIDVEGVASDYTVTFSVSNVAPQVALPQTATFGAGFQFTMAGSFIDVGPDGIWWGTVNFGDGTGTQPLIIDQSNKSFVLTHSYATVGAYTLTVSVTDFTTVNHQPTALSLSGTNQISVSVVQTSLQVVNLTTTASGFDLQFNRAINVSDIALYGNGQVTPPITVVGAESGLVRGSLIWDAVTNTMHWVKTDGVLQPDTYRVALASGTIGNTFHDAILSSPLDGNADGMAGDDYVQSNLVIAPSIARVLSLPDFARGQSQPVIVNEHGTQGNITEHGPISASNGLPIFISEGAGIKQLDFRLNFDPMLLQFSTTAADLVTTSNWSAVATLISPGVLHVVLTSLNDSDLGSGPQAAVVLKNVIVPATAPYGNAQVLRLTNVIANGTAGGAVTVIADDAVHKATDIGDATGDGTVGGADAAAIAQVIVGRNTGFQSNSPGTASAQLVDPIILADLTGDGTLSGLDAADASQMFTDPSSQPQIPSPRGIGTVGNASLSTAIQTAQAKLVTAVAEECLSGAMVVGSSESRVTVPDSSDAKLRHDDHRWQPTSAKSRSLNGSTLFPGPIPLLPGITLSHGTRNVNNSQSSALGPIAGVGYSTPDAVRDSLRYRDACFADLASQPIGLRQPTLRLGQANSEVLNADDSLDQVWTDSSPNCWVAGPRANRYF